MKTAAPGVYYPPGGALPPAWPLPGGRVLVHNHVRHTTDFTQGQNGFRFWLQDCEDADAPPLVECRCGYAPGHAMHYAVDRSDK